MSKNVIIFRKGVYDVRYVLAGFLCSSPLQGNIRDNCFPLFIQQADRSNFIATKRKNPNLSFPHNEPLCVLDRLVWNYLIVKDMIAF